MTGQPNRSRTDGGMLACLVKRHNAIARASTSLRSTPSGDRSPCPRSRRGPTTEGTRDHVDISPERDTLPRGPSPGPRSGNPTSRRNIPPSMVNIAIAAATLLCIGALLGAIWTSQVLQSRLRRQADEQAEERRTLAKEWAAVHRPRGECPHCSTPLPARNRYFAPTAVRD